MSDNTNHNRSVLVIDETLPPGRAANAAAMLALTLGATVPDLPGAPFSDRSGATHPGLVPAGVVVLKAPGRLLRMIRQRAADTDVLLVDFPAAGQRTTDYDEFRRQVAALPPEEIDYAGVALHGPRKVVNRLTGTLPLLR